MKKILIVCTLCSSLFACQSANEAFSLKKKNTTVLEAENDIEYFITKFSRVYNLNFDQKYKLESQIKSYFYKIEGLEEKKFLQNFINYLTQK